MFTTVRAKKYQITADPVKKHSQYITAMIKCLQSEKPISVLPMPDIIIISAKTKLGSNNASRHWLESDALFASLSLFLSVVLSSHLIALGQKQEKHHTRKDFFWGNTALPTEQTVGKASKNSELKDDA